MPARYRRWIKKQAPQGRDRERRPNPREGGRDHERKPWIKKQVRSRVPLVLLIRLRYVPRTAPCLSCPPEGPERKGSKLGARVTPGHALSGKERYDQALKRLGSKNSSIPRSAAFPPRIHAPDRDRRERGHGSRGNGRSRRARRV